jgi:phosphatidylglycerol:prolipoprotein diacylglycerol transferase
MVEQHTHAGTLHRLHLATAALSLHPRREALVHNTAMLTFPQINPVALQLGPVAIHWYGLTYLAAFGLFMLLALLRLRHQPYASITGPGAWSRRDVEDMLFLGVLGVIVGGRLGYCLFYKPGYYLANPLEIFMVWKGGMSFHGGMLGVIVSQWWFAYSRSKPFLQVMDFVAPCVPTGLAAGRLGNFLNGELWGREADASLPWAMVFPQSGSNLPRHPSQLYQFLLEGLLLFIILWLYARKERKQGQVAAVFLVGYGAFRFTAEYFREPDAHLGVLALNMTMGQWLCVPMILFGVLLWVWAQTQPQAPRSSPARQAARAGR